MISTDNIRVSLNKKLNLKKLHKINKIKLNIQNSRKSYLQTIFTKIMFKKCLVKMY